MSLSIDEDHVLLVLTSTSDFQSDSSGAIQKRIINLILALTTNIILALILVTVAFWLPQLNIYSEKTGPYECGFDPIGSARLPFSIKFFLIAITFLLFDLEIALLLPLPWALQSNNLISTLIIALILIIILILGLLYEWLNKGLEWTE